jgi:hypothetical protein
MNPTRSPLLTVLSLLALASTARAQQPAYPYPYPQEPIYPYPSPAALPPAGAPQLAPLAPPGVAAPAPAYPYPSYPYPYYYMPPPVYAPMYPWPAPVARPRPVRRIPAPPPPPVKPVEKARFFSVGGRATGLDLNYQIGGAQTMLWGGGIELRFRTRGHFGLETSLDFLHGDFQLNGPIARDSMPFTISAMLYLFNNTDDRHFNLYFLGGGGVVSTTMSLVDEHNAQVKQDFTEWEAHLGVGAELRFRWLALRADVRGLALWRYDGDLPAGFYSGVDGGPVPASSYGIQGTAGAAFWF